MRIHDHPVLGKLEECKKVTITFNGRTYEGYEGDTIASALMANGIKKLRNHEDSGTGRGIYCNIGHCFECRVRVGENRVVRACLTPIVDGMEIHSLSRLDMEE